jgi:uncharacterized protein with HEPN domain
MYKKEFLDYIEDIIEAMNDAIEFARDMGMRVSLKIRKQSMPL